jgi:hypothetical protein
LGPVCPSEETGEVVPLERLENIVSFCQFHQGGLKRAPAANEEGYGGQAIFFTNEPGIVRREKEHVVYCGTEEQDVLCIDDRQVMTATLGNLVASVTSPSWSCHPPKAMSVLRIRFEPASQARVHLVSVIT